MKKNTNVDMLSGSLWTNVLKFTLPFMLTTFLQHLYNAADVIVVGRYAEDPTALAGVGTTGSITTLILNMFLGLSVGVSVSLGRSLGAKDDDAVHKTVHTGVTISILGGLMVSLIGIAFATPLLSMIEVPDDVMQQAKIYMQIIFAGKMPSLIYTFGAAMLRANGDTKTPLLIVTVTGIINVVLNLIFVLCLKMNADGVALATTIAQILNAIAVLYFLTKQHGNTKLYFKKLKIYKEQLADIFKIGLPSGIQSTIFSAANVIVQSSVNGFGAAAMSGSAAASNICEFYNGAVNSFYQASVSFVSQNFGAKQFKRITKIIFTCIAYVMFLWAIIILITIFFKNQLIGLYLPNDPAAVPWGLKRLFVVGCSYGLLGIMNVMCGALRGTGLSFSAMISAIIGVVGIRILWVTAVFPLIGTFESLFFCFPLSWFGTFMLYTVMYFINVKKLQKQGSL